MATAKKHMERSHRSYHKKAPFAAFESRAAIRETGRQVKSGRVKNAFDKLAETVKKVIHRTTHK